MHLFGFITRIYHDTRSPERQINNSISLKPTPTPYSPRYLRSYLQRAPHDATVEGKRETT
jgi:hypothetical protein